MMKNGYFEFLTHFVDLTDPREDRGRNHNLLDMVAIALCGTICGANTWADIERFAKAHIDWFERFLELPFVALKKKFTGLKTIGLISRERILANGKTQHEGSYFISSLPPIARRHAEHVRNHWRLENTLHHTLDVTFTEDASRIRKGNGADIISVLRRLALSILQQDTTVKDNIRGKRLTAGWDLSKLEVILLAFSSSLSPIRHAIALLRNDADRGRLSS